MLAKRIIPCLDVTGGRVVKGVNFIDLVDAGDPVEIARKYDEQGADELVFLDITASSDARETMVDVVRRTAEQVFIPLTVGGGIRSVEDIRRMLLAGADKTSVNTAAILRPDLIREGAERFGSQCIVLAIDARNVPGEERWIVYTHGGRKATELDAERFCSRAWMPTEPAPDMTANSRAVSRTRFPFRSSPPAAPVRSNISPKCSGKGMPTRFSPQASSISGPIRFRKPSDSSGSAVFRSGKINETQSDRFIHHFREKQP